MDIKVDFSDIEPAFAQMRKEVDEAMRKCGESFVAKARETGDYNDRTGNLRASNFYRVEDNTLTLGNSAQYANLLEQKRGKKVSTDEAFNAIIELQKKFE